MYLKQLFWPSNPWSKTRTLITVIVIFLSWNILLELSQVGPLTILGTYLTSNYDSKTTGNIVQSTSRLQGGRPGGTSCRYYIRYTYEVNKVLYFGDMVNLGPHVERGHCGKGAKKVLEKYPAGKVVTVYYDSTSPENSLLENIGMDTERLVFQSLACFVLSLITWWAFRPD
jgi:hypothetical protein